MSTPDFCETVESHLGILGYKVFGDPDEGWDWEVGDYFSPIANCERREEAAAAALHDLVQRTDDLRQAADEVVGRWDKGDLAAAVRELDLCLKVLAGRRAARAKREQGAPAQADDDDVSSAWLVHGEGPLGVWNSGAHLDFDCAIKAALTHAGELIKQGHVIDLEVLEARLRSEQGCCFVDDLALTFVVEPILVTGC